MQKVTTKFIDWYRRLPDKKRHVEFITAVLSVPVMLTVIIINLNNLTQQKKDALNQKSNSTTPIQVIITGGNSPTVMMQPTISPSASPTPTPPTCIKEVGPLSIVSPRENEVITKDPVCITIATTQAYCNVKWSYKLDNSDFSDYTDKDICLYNLPNGNRTIQLKIKSTVSDDNVTLQRSFVYQGNYFPTPTPYTASSSASL